MRYILLNIIILSISFNSALAGPCLDPDGDGWGWDGTQTCVINDNSSTPQIGPCLDPDGDGWGWNGVESCQVPAEVVASPGDCIDSDGDGWGWNGVESCQMSIIIPAPSRPTVTITIPQPTVISLPNPPEVTITIPQPTLISVPPPVPVTILAPTSGDSSDFKPLFSSERSSLRVLFVGNSYLAYRPPLAGTITNLSVANQITSLIRVNIPSVFTRVRSIGGGTLKQHWDAGNGNGSNGKSTARREIETGNYDLVVLQGRYDTHESQANENRFLEYADRFASLAQRNNSKVLFYGLWARDTQISSARGDTFGPVAHYTYLAAAVRNDASYSPNGMAYGELYQRLSRNMSDVQIEDMYTADNIHPNIPLAYMVANVVYGTIFGEQAPSLREYRPTSLSNQIGNLMRDVAWDTVEQYSYGE